jgi:hypothetical protein
MTEMMEQRVYRLLQRIKADGYKGEWLPEVDEVMSDIVSGTVECWHCGSRVAHDPFHEGWPAVHRCVRAEAIDESESELRADAERELARDAAQARAEELDGPRD